MRLFPLALFRQAFWVASICACAFGSSTSFGRLVAIPEKQEKRVGQNFKKKKKIGLRKLPSRLTNSGPSTLLWFINANKYNLFSVREGACLVATLSALFPVAPTTLWASLTSIWPSTSWAETSSEGWGALSSTLSIPATSGYLGASFSNCSFGTKGLLNLILHRPT